MNHYFALLDASGKPKVTLPWSGVAVAEDGTISGVTGAAAMWNGIPPVWCWEIVEVKSEHPWKEARTSEKNCVWCRI